MKGALYPPFGILAVDDEEDVLDTIAEALETAKVDRAQDFKTAVKKINTNAYDLAILDIMGVDGLTLLGIVGCMVRPTSGRVRVLATSTPRRLPAFPDVPTLVELGYTNAVVSNWSGIMRGMGLAGPFPKFTPSTARAFSCAPETWKQVKPPPPITS